MVSKRYMPILVMLAVVSTGCVTRSDTAWPDPRPLGSDLTSYRPPQEPEPLPPEFEIPTGVITLRLALSLALARSPSFEAVAWDVRAAEARTLQAGLYPNPELDVEAEEFAGSGPLSGDDAATTTISLAQLVELGGKRGARLEVAGLEQALAGLDYEAMRLQVLTATTRAFVELLAAQRHRALAEESIVLTTDFLDTVDARVTAGKVSPLEKTKAEVALFLEQIALRSAEQRHEAARTALAATWGGKVAVFEQVEGDFDSISRVPALDILLTLVLQNPVLERWSVEVAVRKAGVDLEEANRWPDATISGGVSRFEEGAGSDHALTLGFSIPIPVSNRNQGGVIESRALLAKAKAERRAALAQAHADIVSRQSKLVFSHSAATALRESVLPAARRVFIAVSAGYKVGKFEYLDVLDARRTLLDTRRQHIDVLRAYHMARAEVEHLVGRALDLVRPSSVDEEGNDGD